MTGDLWQREVAKLGGEELVNLITEIRDGQATIVDRLDKMDERHKKSDEAVESLRAAFPTGDTDGHRRYHQTMIEMLAEKRRLRVAIQEKTISALIWSLIVGASIVAWKGLLALLLPVFTIK